MKDEFDDHKEPEEIFQPLTGREYAELYEAEMGSFSEDIRFYLDQCGNCGKILELGCGEGRISRAFAAEGFSVTAIDLSLFMLRRAREKKCPGHNIHYICMDMTELAFSKGFDCILIPYNTLNLLRTMDSIHNCIKMCRAFLNPKGRLLLQVHCFDSASFTENSGKTFQFRILPQPKGEAKKAKIIKETLRSYDSKKNELILEERYRIRPHGGTGIKRDLHHFLHLAACSAVQWEEILHAHSFTNIRLYSDYRKTSYLENPSSLLLIQAESAS